MCPGCDIGVTALTIVLYALSPLDMIPEAVFGPLGLLDDLAVMVKKNMGSILVSNVLRQVGLLDEQPGRRVAPAVQLRPRCTSTVFPLRISNIPYRSILCRIVYLGIYY